VPEETPAIPVVRRKPGRPKGRKSARRDSPRAGAAPQTVPAGVRPAAEPAGFGESLDLEEEYRPLDTRDGACPARTNEAKYHVTLFDDSDRGFLRAQQRGITPVFYGARNSDGEPYVLNEDEFTLTPGGYLRWGTMVVGVETVRHYEQRVQERQRKADAALARISVKPGEGIRAGPVAEMAGTAAFEVYQAGKKPPT